MVYMYIIGDIPVYQEKGLCNGNAIMIHMYGSQTFHSFILMVLIQLKGDNTAVTTRVYNIRIKRYINKQNSNDMSVFRNY